MANSWVKFGEAELVVGCFRKCPNYDDFLKRTIMRRNQLLLFLSLTLSGCAAQQGEAPLETPSLPPEPKAPLHEQAHEAPQLEQELAANEAYANLWSLPRDDLNLFLTCSDFLNLGSHQILVHLLVCLFPLPRIGKICFESPPSVA